MVLSIRVSMAFLPYLLLLLWMAPVQAESSTLRQARAWEAKQARAETMLGAYPLAAAVRDSDPVSFAMLIDTLARRLDKPQQQHTLQKEMYQLVNEIVRKKLLSAEDEQINWFFSNELQVALAAKKSDPVACGKAVVTQRDMSAEFLSLLPKSFVDDRVKKLAELVKSSGGKSERQHSESKAEQAMAGVMETLYTLHGERLDSFGQYTGDKRELMEQCNIAIDMLKAISLLPDSRKANLYRAMLKDNQTQEK